MIAPAAAVVVVAAAGDCCGRLSTIDLLQPPPVDSNRLEVVLGVASSFGGRY